MWLWCHEVSFPKSSKLPIHQTEREKFRSLAFDSSGFWCPIPNTAVMTWHYCNQKQLSSLQQIPRRSSFPTVVRVYRLSSSPHLVSRQLCLFDNIPNIFNSGCAEMFFFPESLPPPQSTVLTIGDRTSSWLSGSLPWTCSKPWTGLPWGHLGSCKSCGRGWQSFRLGWKRNNMQKVFRLQATQHQLKLCVWLHVHKLAVVSRNPAKKAQTTILTFLQRKCQNLQCYWPEDWNVCRWNGLHHVKSIHSSVILLLDLKVIIDIFHSSPIQTAANHYEGLIRIEALLQLSAQRRKLSLG